MSQDFKHNKNSNSLGISKEIENVSNEPKDHKDILLKNAQAKGYCKRADCHVIAQRTVFFLDSFYLMSWSEYFRCYFSTDNLEKNKTIQLHNISASTFQLILDILSTSDTNLLTEDNINDVWHAAHQLQIAVLVKICDELIVARLSLNNVAMYKEKADILHSRGVLKGISRLIITNFSALRNTEAVINLNTEDLKQVVESDELSVESEDIVLQAIYRWVDSFEKERKKDLADILSCTRYCLASYSCIAELSQNPLSLNDSRVKEIFNKASTFKINTCYMGFWPTAAIYRDSMGYDHLAVYCSERSKFRQISLKNNEMLKCKDIPSIKASKVAVVNGRLIACKFTSVKGNIELFSLTDKMWLQVSDFQVAARDTCLFMLSHESSIFVITQKKMYRFDANDWSTPSQETTYDIVSPKHVMSFYSQILVFTSVKYGGGEQMAVHAWHLDTNTWKKIVDLGKFTADSMTSYKDDTNGYILNRFGHLWKLVNTKTVVFTYLGRIWDANVKLRGALLFRHLLHVFVTDTPTCFRLTFQACLVDGIFLDVQFHCTGKSSNVVSVLKERQSSTTV